MSERLIIDNRSKFGMHDVLGCVADVLAMGRVSADGSAYCYVTAYKHVVVYATKNKASDTLVIMNNDNDTPMKELDNE